MATPQQQAENGLSKVAHAIRRSTALYVAMQVTEPGSSIEAMLVNADRLAAWIGGAAVVAEQEQDASGPLGEAWPLL